MCHQRLTRQQKKLKTAATREYRLPRRVRIKSPLMITN
ncbi:hypothetical protein AB46_0224 [Escherichia coli 3-267-03_S1_C2]|nr:hypothetical protein AB46_0224 [Escherichia coli 3-267-03_S1_C2]